MYLGDKDSRLSVGWKMLVRATVCLAFMTLSLAAATAEAKDTVKPAQNSPDGDVPPYGFKYSNGLYATIAGFVSIKEPELKNQKKFSLKVPSFKKKLPVRAIIQNESAPLVVVLLGIDGRADGALGKLWPSWFSDAGYHVLTFDSTFLPSFTEISGHGVTGNLLVESERISEVIAAFLNLSEMKGKVSKLGIVGMSYGGIQSLVLGQMAKEGRLPFNVDGIQAYSPPVNIRRTGEVIDRWFSEDRWQYTLVELANKLSGHKPVGPDSTPPFDDSLMRAGIAAVFRLGLVDVIVRNDQIYKLGVLPKGNNFDSDYIKRDYAAIMGYTAFMTEMSYPYWQKKANMQQLSDLTSPVELGTLIEKQPPYSQVIITLDDPLNTADDLAAFQSRAAGRNVLFLPRGGHLGFVNDPWTKAKLMTLFKPVTQTAAQVAR
ncbi:MAG TPA: hypothetical protein VEK08_12690 [Planctomycetota bacterium]|nr:hypothetical protein [Planctomycetota bacterium]